LRKLGTGREIGPSPFRRAYSGGLPEYFGELLNVSKPQAQGDVGNAVFGVKEHTFASLELQGCEVCLGAYAHVAMEKVPEVLR
jgi:hypothetical protein